MPKTGLVKGELKTKRDYEGLVYNLYKKAKCVVEKERYVCGFYGGKRQAIPHDLFNKSSDVVALAYDGIHLAAVTSGDPKNVQARKDFFDEHIQDFPGVICEVWHFVESGDFVLERRVEMKWQDSEFDTEVLQRRPEASK